MKNTICRYPLKKPLYYILGIICISLLTYYTYILLSKDIFIHPEVFQTLPGMLKINDANIFINAISKIFDMGIIENNAYRPRVLCFFIHWLDCTLLILMSPYVSKFLPFFSFLAGFLLFYITFLIIRRFCPQCNFYFALFLSIILLFSQNFQAQSFLFVRSSKALTPAISLLIFYLFLILNKPLKHIGIISIIKLFILSFFIFTLLTLDEQVLATLSFFLFISLILPLIRERERERERERVWGTKFIYIAILSCFLYGIWYFIVGKITFTLFSGPLYTHPHQFSSIFSSHFFTYLGNSLEIWLDLWNILFAPFPKEFTLTIFLFLLIAKYKCLVSKNVTIAFALIVFSFALIYPLIAAHPPIYSYPDLRKSMYLSTSLVFLYIGIIGIISYIKLHKNTILVIFIFLSTNVIYNIYNNESYRNTHIFPNGHLTILDMSTFNKNIPSQAQSIKKILDQAGINHYIFTSLHNNKHNIITPNN